MSILNNQDRNLRLKRLLLIGEKGESLQRREKYLIWTLKKWKLFVNAEIRKEPNWEGEYQKQSYRRHNSS